MSQDDMIEIGIESIVLPTGQVVTVNEVRTFNFNQHVNSLRFSFEAPTTKPSGVDSLSGWIRAIDTDLGRVAVLAHHYFRFRSTLYVTDATIKQLVRP